MVTEKQFKISEMTKLIQVEAHVLRYWEEELQLPIKRNELGHRYYTQDDVERFCQIKKLKEKGIQLKGIRSMLDLPQESVAVKLPAAGCVTTKLRSSEYMSTKLPSAEMTSDGLTYDDEKGEKAYRLQLLLKGLVKEAVQESNALMADDIKESIIKELDYQFRVAAEEQELHQREYRKQQEEYFEKLDHMIQDSMQTRKKRNLGLFRLSAKQKNR